MKKNELTPNQSVGDFLIGDLIVNYLHLPHTITHHDENSFSYDSYNFYEHELIVWVENKKIETICCDSTCYWQGQNLIKMLFEEFLIQYKLKPDSTDQIYLLVNNRGQNQIVYDFDKIGLMVCVWRKRIVTILVANYQDDME